MKEAKLKIYILYDSIHMTFLEKAKQSGQKQISGCQGLEVKETVNCKRDILEECSG